MIDRIKKLMKEKKLTPTQFSEEIGIQRSSVSHVLSGRNKPSLDFMLKIKSHFSEVNLDWLLLGSGKMIIEDEPDPVISVNEPSNPKEPELNFSHEKLKPEVSEPFNQSIVETEIQPGYGKPEMTATKRPEKVILLYHDNTFEVFGTKSKRP